MNLNKYLTIFGLALAMLFFTTCMSTEFQDTTAKQEIDSNWEFRASSPDSTWLSASVPGCIHTDLLSHNKIQDPFYRTNEKHQQWIDKVDWVYRTTFNVSSELVKMGNIEMLFKGLDTYADVKLNGKQILSANNMFREWNVPIKELLKEGENTLEIFFHSPINEGVKLLKKFGYALPAVNDQSENGEMGDKKVSVFTRKAPYHYGWDWGPRFVTSGIWRPIEIHAWNEAKINDLFIEQKSLSDKKAELSAIIEIQSNEKANATVNIYINDENKVLSTTELMLSEGTNSVNVDFIIDQPKRWWPNGLGEQNRYDIKAEVIISGTKVQCNKKVGLRTISVVQKPDSLGKSFYFEVNGHPVFMKGANHIPNDIFLSRVSPEIYEREINAAVDANMNMLRVWGGGIYEEDVFYDLCDEKGILIWQDFMFACSMYPGNEAFLRNIESEAIDNVKRLRNHPCIALWCGNNEIDWAWQQNNPNGGWGWKQKYTDEQRAEIWKAYNDIFRKILPSVVEKYDASRMYWHSSPMAGENEHASSKIFSGDMHYWGVWHSSAPFSDFQLVKSRFMSEYGFQSFPNIETVKKYALPEEWDIESEVMAAHQRSGIGNLRIKEYMSWYFNVPKDFETFLYVGQALQAKGIKAAIEAHRRDMPFCMGTLYWQMNDCWPVASWSGIDYYGQWKAMHYFVKKAFNDILITYKENEGKLDFFVVCDKLEQLNEVDLIVETIDFAGDIIWSAQNKIKVEANTSTIVHSEAIDELLKDKNRNNVFIRTRLVLDNVLLTENLHFFENDKLLDLPEATIQFTVNNNNTIELNCDKLARYVFVSVEGEDVFFSDNYFDLLPGESKTITIDTETDIQTIKNNIKVMSLCNSY